MARLILNLLGTFQATLDDRPVTNFEYDKVRALLAYLAVESDRPHRREKLIGLLWPGYPESSARRNLAQALYSLRNALGERDAKVPTLLVTHRTIQLNPASDVQLDVDHFVAATGADSLTELERAVAIYRGRFLSGLLVDDCPVFDEWVALRREALHQRAVEALHRLAGEYERARDLGKALEVAQRQVVLDPYWEAGRRTVMRLLDLKGQRNAALAQYAELRALLGAELGVEPEPETTKLYERIRLTSEATLVERAFVTLQGVGQRAKRDRAYQARLWGIVVVAVAVVAALLWPRPPGRPLPRDPTMATLPDGRPTGGLSLWPEISFQPHPANPLVRELGSSGDLLLASTEVQSGGSVHVMCARARDWPNGPVVIVYAKSLPKVYRLSSLTGDPILAGDGSGFDAWSVGMPALVQDGSGWRLYYAGDDAGPFGEGLAIGWATADDPAGTWTRRPESVLTPGGPGEWDSCSVAPASVVVTEDGYKLYYLGSPRDDCDRWMVGMAESEDGIEWIKYNDPATHEAPYAASDPVLAPGGPDDWDGRGLLSAMVRDTGLGWEMFYTGESVAGRRAIGYAWSTEGDDWHRFPSNPILGPEDDPFATDAIRVGGVVVDGSTYQMLYDYAPTGELGFATGTVWWPIVVDTTDDELNADGDCSLREAIEAANTDTAVDACPPGDGHDWVIVPGGNYRLTLSGLKEDSNQTGDLDIRGDLTLQGAGADVTIVDGDGADRVIHIHGSTVSVTDLTITHGWVPPDEWTGGGLRNDSGSVTVSRCTISHNVAPFGGGLHNNPGPDTVATMTVIDTRVISNTATGGAAGIWNMGATTTATSLAVLNVTRSTVAGNVADGSLRAFGAGGAAGIGSGLEPRNEGLVRVTIRDSTVSGNVASGTGQQMGCGGGIGISAGEATVINSTVSGNRAMGQGPVSGLGGGLFVTAMYAATRVTLVNSTVTDNQAANSGAGMAAMSMACLCGDTADPESFCFRMPLNPQEGPTVVVYNTIIADNTAPTDAGCSLCEGTIVSDGYNLEDGNTCPFADLGDLPDTDPLLNPLAFNGGPTWTHMPQPGSPVIDAGRCPEITTDQRGYRRPVDLPHTPNAADACDIGAVEVPAD